MSQATLKLAADSSNPELRIVWAEVYAPNIPDSDGEFMDAEAIRTMAYKFLKEKKLDSIDVQHDNKLVPGAHVVESFIARKGDDTFIEGSWVVGLHVPDDSTWDRIKKGEINGFSIEAFVTKQPTEIEIEIPPVLMGKTSKSEDHEHEFYVAYDANGNFKGGTTNNVNGHSHKILKGTVTETVNNHSHRFSFVESLKAG